MKLTDACGQPKYQALAALVKMALSMSNGQVDIECPFSINRRVFIDQTLLGEKRFVQYAHLIILQCDGCMDKVPLTSGLFAAFRSASKCYKEDLDKHKADATEQLQFWQAKSFCKINEDLKD